MLSKLKSRFSFTFFAAPLAALLLFGLHAGKLVDFHETDGIDLRFRLRGVKKADSRITVIGIDDNSVKALGQWPWPRSIHAGLLNVISRYKPAAIFFDILFTEASPDPSQDEALKEAVRKAGNVVLPFFYHEEPFSVEFPIAGLKNAAHGTAYVNVPDQEDGRTRRIRAFLKTPAGVFYPPAFMMESFLKGGEPSVKNIPLDRDGNFWINFPGRENSFNMISFGEVISRAGTEQHDFLKERVEGKLVFVGQTATGTTDLQPTPFSNHLPGVFVHAAMAHTLLSKEFLRPLPEFLHLMILLLISFSAGKIFKALSPAYGFLATLGLIVGYFLAAMIAFFAGWIFPLFVPAAVIMASYGVMLFIKYSEIRFQRELAERELQMAAKIQTQFLPSLPPEQKGADMAFECRFAKQVGGDLYDWVELGPDELGFCVGDVSGKGMPAAIYMAKALGDFRSIDKKNKTPGAVLEEFNQRLLSSPASGMFLTLFYGKIDFAARRLDYASAGHEHALWLDSKSGSVRTLEAAQGLPLGMFETDYASASVIFGSGDSLLLYSDGVRELRNPNGEEWGIETLKKEFARACEPGGPAARLIEILFSRMQNHLGKAYPHDDRTLFCLRFQKNG